MRIRGLGGHSAPRPALDQSGPDEKGLYHADHGGHVHPGSAGQVGQADGTTHVIHTQRLQEPAVIPGQSEVIDVVQREAVLDGL